MTAGYSGKPLAEKLGLKPGMKIFIFDAPENYWMLLDRVPDDYELAPSLVYPLDFIHLFATERKVFESQFPIAKAALMSDGMLWASWPKVASKRPTTLSENLIREVGLANGLVDVKVAAIDETWSGFKFVYRLADRKPDPRSSDNLGQAGGS